MLQIAPQLKKFAGDAEKGHNLTQKLFNFLFEMPKLENKEANVPKCKSKITRKKAFNLLITLCQGYDESTIKAPTSENYFTLFKDLYIYHKDMDEIERNTTVNLKNFDTDVGLRSSVGFAGLRNFGATCYMNSVIQQLYMIPDLRYGILASDVQTGKYYIGECIDDKQYSSLFQLQLIFANLQETEKKYYTPRDFTKTISIEGGPVDVRRQQDAQEFFNILSDNIENELKNTKNEKLLKEILGGEICSELKSLEDEYEYVSQNMEPFFSVQLDIKNRKSIQEALDYYIKPDILEGDNKYFCEKYGKKIRAQKRSFLNKTSNTLIINLKRFEFDYSTFRKYKVNDYCEFPMELNIKPWTKEGIKEKENIQKLDESDDGELRKKEEENKEEVQVDDEKIYLYEAVGVVVHSGGAEGGHYYSYIKDRERGKWYEFNDTRVSPFDLKNLADETFGGESKGGNLLGNTSDFMGDYSRSKNAYFIIYQRKYPQPLPSAQLVDPNHEYVKGIPKSVYQHIWDENMLFMKRMYFFDSEYLHFIREFLSLNNFERKLYITDCSLTKKQRKMKEAADILGVNKDSMKIHEPIKRIEMFDVTKEELDASDDNNKVASSTNFDPEKDLNEQENVGESSFDNQYEDDDKIVVDTRHIDPLKLSQAKDLLTKPSNSDPSDEKLKQIEEDIKKNPALYVIKFSTLFALKIKEHIKDSFSFISLLQQLNSMYEMHADGCMWLLKYLSYNKHMVEQHLLKNQSEEERENFRALLITAISLVAKNEEKDFFNEGTDEYVTEEVVDFDQNRDIFFAKKVPKASLIRFMQVFFENMLDDAREHFRNYEDYFQVLFYFARLGYMETKYLVKAKGIFKLLDFIMNNSPPFHHNSKRKKMGNALSEPNFRTPMEILSHIVRSCVTQGIKESGTYSSVSLIQSKEQAIDIPVDEIKYLNTRMCFTMELLNLQYDDSLTKIVCHLCWDDRKNTKFFMDELVFSAYIQKNNVSSLAKRLNILKSILLLQDTIQLQRIDIVCGFDQDPPVELTKDDSNLLGMARSAQVDYPLFTLEVIKIISDACNCPIVLEYLTKHKERLCWARDFLDNLRETLPDHYNTFRSASTFDVSDGMATIDSCIESLIQIFPDGSDGFRSQKATQSQAYQEKNNQEDSENERGSAGFSGQPMISEELDAQLRNIDFFGADDDFMNVASAPSEISTNVPKSQASQRRGDRVDFDEETSGAFNNDSFTK